MLPTTFTLPHAQQPLLFVRHGATQPNLDGLRCGGDVDVPMTHVGEAQILHASQQLLQWGVPVDVIISSALLRAQQSAAILSRVLGGLPVVVLPSFNERLLGQWNLQPSISNEVALRSGVTPPGGESNPTFTARVRDALTHLHEALDGVYGGSSRSHNAAILGKARAPLMVGSKGVSRVMGELLRACALQPGTQDKINPHGAPNAAILQFDLATMAPRHATHPNPPSVMTRPTLAKTSPALAERATS